MKVEACGQVGPSLLSDGVGTQPFRQGKLGEQIVQQLHGRFPPGGVLALFATTTPVAHSAASMIVWEEVPI